jgi:multidrug efflux pump subunit AcrA (membrane-fusion protein)
MKPKPLSALLLCLALLMLLLMAAPLPGKEPAVKTAPPPAPPSSTDLTLSGKLFCSLKRPVIVFFPCEVLEVMAKPGQKVAAGELLARCRLLPEAILQINRRLSPPHIKELEVKLAEVDKNLALVREKSKGLQQLASQKLTSEQSLKQVQQEQQLLGRQRAALQQQLQQEKRQGLDDQTVLRKQLGQPVSPGHLPQDITLTAPLNGYVVWVHPFFREGAEVKPNEAVFQIGVMNPMILKAQAHEIEAVQLSVGDEAEVSFEALPDRKFRAKISSVYWSPASLAVEQPSYYEVELEVPNPDLVLKEGLKAKIVIQK